MTEALPWWWLSFCDADLPKGSQFLGVAIVGPAAHIGQAAFLAHALGVNPGGEVQGLPIPADMIATVDVKWRERLLSREECAAFDVEMKAKQAEGAKP